MWISGGVQFAAPAPTSCLGGAAGQLLEWADALCPTCCMYAPVIRKRPQHLTNHNLSSGFNFRDEVSMVFPTRHPRKRVGNVNLVVVRTIGEAGMLCDDPFGGHQSLRGEIMSREQTVCVVDDDRAVRNLFCSFIESAGLRTQAFETAEEFLESFDPASAACLVLDYDLPGMSGLDVLGRLGSRSAEIPVLLTSGSDDPSLAARAKDAGAWAFLPKVQLSNPRLLVDRIRAALRERAESCVGRSEEGG